MVPPEVESCIPLADQHIERLLDKYTLNKVRNTAPEKSPTQLGRASRTIAKKRIDKKREIVARRNNGINVIGYFSTLI